MLFWFIFILVVFFCLGEFNLNGRWNRPLMQGLGIFIITIVSALRFDVGFDYPSYYKTIVLDNFDFDFEILSGYVFSIGRNIGYPPLSFIIITVLISSFVFSTLCKYSANIFVAIMVYICFFYLNSLNTIRQSLAISITFWGVRYIFQKSFFRYFLVCIFASLFHSSALLACVIYPFYRFISTRYIPVILILIAIGYKTILETFLTIGYYDHVSNKLLTISEENMTEGGGMYIRIAMLLVIVCLYLLTWLKKVEVDRNLLSLCSIGCIFPFLIGTHMGMRIAEYFLIYLCLVIPQVLCAYKSYFRALCVILFMCYFLLLIATGRNQKRAPFLPYQTIFNIDNIKDPVFRQS